MIKQYKKQFEEKKDSLKEAEHADLDYLYDLPEYIKRVVHTGHSTHTQIEKKLKVKWDGRTLLCSNGRDSFLSISPIKTVELLGNGTVALKTGDLSMVYLYL